MTHELYGERKHSEQTCTDRRRNSTVRVKLPSRAELAWELRPEPAHAERSVLSNGTSDGNDNPYKTLQIVLEHLKRLSIRYWQFASKT